VFESIFDSVINDGSLTYIYIYTHKSNLSRN
jgi:hypothetical protein